MLRAFPLTALLILGPWLSTEAAAQGFFSRLTGPRQAERLASSDPAVRAEAARTFGRWGEPRRAVRALGQALEEERDVTVRQAIVAALARRGDPAAVPALLEALEGANLDPATVVLALGAFDDDRAARALIAALGQEDVQEAAVRALLRLGPRAVPPLLGALAEPALALPSIRVLGMIGDRRATPALVARLRAEREPVRVAAAHALGLLGDRRAAPALGELLADSSTVVVSAALEALAGAGEPSQAPAIAAKVAEGQPAEQRAALRALLAVQPEAAIPFMERAVAAGDPVLGRTSVDLALSSVHPGVVPLLYGLLQEGSRAQEAAGALAEVDGGRGIPVLVEVTGAGGPRSGATARALAVALRKWDGQVDGDLLRDALAVLRRTEMAPARSLLLRSVARDPQAQADLVRALGASDPSLRATAARGLELLVERGASEALGRAIRAEEDAEAFRRMATAAVALGEDVPYHVLHPHLRSLETGPEAMALAAASRRSHSERQRDRVGRLLRAALRADDARVRAGAARALAVGGEREAWRALVIALDDPAPEVRLAAATALADLEVPEAAEVIVAQHRIEEDPRVAPALLDAASPSASRGRIPPELGVARGTETLRVRIAAVGEEGQHGVPVEVVLPDGRWLRLRTLPTGELVLVDLPSSVADVRVRVSE